MASRAAGSLAVTGVQIFFLISGYVITRLLMKESKETGQINVFAFYKRRALRILPPLLVYFLALMALAASGYIDVELGSLGAAVAFTCNTGFATCGWFAGHTWSLAVEEQFYLLWPAIFIIAGPRHRVFVTVAALASLMFVALARGYVFAGNDQSFSYIAIGALMALSSSLQQLCVQYVKPVVWSGAFASLAIATVSVSDVIMLILKPALLTMLVFGAGNFRLLSALLTSRACQWIGLSSYSAYLWQQFFLAETRAYAGDAPPIILLPIVVWASWRFIERPSIRLGRNSSAVTMPQMTMELSSST